ncbi:MAG: hemerythrin domain-containing protein [Epulopiscium sp.]|nr:hemerythrin domain-containing protein [Candidatus Epulonipiscium sp.]
MLNVTSLERQHHDIANIMEGIKDHLNKNVQIEDTFHIAMQINMLAGKLKIHLNTEDEHMYPLLLADGDKEIKEMAKLYMDEMGYINEEFAKYKNSFNTKSKIEKNVENFKAETKRIFEILENRVLKEETELYPAIKIKK